MYHGLGFYLGICPQVPFIFDEPVLKESASDRYLPMQSGRNDTRYLMFTLRRGHQMYSPAGKI